MTTILIKKKDTTGAPSSGDLTNATGGAEIAVNTFDKRLYTKDSGGTVVELGTNPTDITTGTVDTTNIEVTNIKAKDGTAAVVLTDSTGAVAVSTPLTANGGVVFNEAGADVDFRVEGDTDANLLFVDASTDRVGIGTDTPAARLEVLTGASNTEVARFGNAVSSRGLRISGFAIGGTNEVGYDLNAPGNGVSAALSFSTLSTERMRLTSAGELLVGGTTSVAVSGGGPGNLTLQRARTGTYQPTLNIFADDTSIGSGDVLGLIKWFGNDTTSNTPTNLAYISAVASGTHAAGDNPTDLVFGCTNDDSETVAEFARLVQAGATSRRFYVRQPTLTNGTDVSLWARGGTAGTENRWGILGVYKHSGITNSCAFVSLMSEDGVENYFWADNSDIFRTSTTASNIGTTGGTVVGTQTSDERLKNISGPVTYGLNEVLAIEPIAFTMKDDPSIPKIGFSAQQVQPIVPEAVYDTKECIDGYTENEETKEQVANSDRTKLAMEYTQLIPVLVNAVKELSAKCDALQAEVNLLKGN